jgi:hypothetical protein
MPAQHILHMSIRYWLNIKGYLRHGNKSQARKALKPCKITSLANSLKCHLRRMICSRYSPERIQCIRPMNARTSQMPFYNHTRQVTDCTKVTGCNSAADQQQILVSETTQNYLKTKCCRHFPQQNVRKSYNEQQDNGSSYAVHALTISL